MVIFGTEIIKNRKLGKYYTDTTENINLETGSLTTKRFWRKFEKKKYFYSLIHAFTSFVTPEISEDWDEHEVILQMDGQTNFLSVSRVNMYYEYYIFNRNKIKFKYIGWLPIELCSQL